MTRPDRRPDPPDPTPGPILNSTGGVVAHDQVAQWVRFADTKATILSAALGVVTTLLVTQLHVVAHQAHDDHGTGRFILTTLATLTVIAFATVLLNLVKAISRRTDTDTTFNRFAWPSLGAHAADEIRQQIRDVDPTDEIWDQTRVLAALAKKKFAALHLAVITFAGYVITAIATLAVAIVQGLWPPVARAAVSSVTIALSETPKQVSHDDLDSASGPHGV